MEDQYISATEMIVRDIAIPYTTNVTSSIHKPVVGGLFELCKNMMQLLHTIRQFIGVFHDNTSTYSEFPWDQRRVHPYWSEPLLCQAYLNPILFAWGRKNMDVLWATNFITSWNDLARNFLIRFFHLENIEAVKRYINLMRKRRRKFSPSLGKV